MSYLATDSLFPEWKVWTQFAVDSTIGLNLDALEESHPIEVLLPCWLIFWKLNSPQNPSIFNIISPWLYIYVQVEINRASEIDEIFDAISYKKGASVIRMLQSYLGAECFQVSLQFSFSSFCLSLSLLV